VNPNLLKSHYLSLIPNVWLQIKTKIISNRNVMELVHEYQLSSVAIPIIYTVKRGYPPDEGAHLALSNNSSSVTLFITK
jgi:hypothetical protein